MRGVVGHTFFDSYGNAISHTGVSLAFGYTGLWLDNVTGFYGTQTRWYDPHTGRWTNEDWIEFYGGQENISAYVHNSPTNSYDPSGTVGEEAIIPVTAVGVGTALITLSGCSKPSTVALPPAFGDPKVRAALAYLQTVKIVDLNAGSPTVGQTIDFKFLADWIKNNYDVVADSAASDNDSWSIGTQKSVINTGPALNCADVAVHILGEYWRRKEEPNENGQPPDWEWRMRDLLRDAIRKNGGPATTREWAHPGTRRPGNDPHRRRY
jgi:RHS repeat-associated protein